MQFQVLFPVKKKKKKKKSLHAFIGILPFLRIPEMFCVRACVSARAYMQEVIAFNNYVAEI